MKTFLALFLALVSFGFAADEKKEDPIVGVWRGFKSRVIIECYPDGSFVKLPDEHTKKGEVVGKWEHVESKSVERKYTLTWWSGKHIHQMTMSKSGDKISGKNQNDHPQEAVRVIQQP